MRRCSTPPAPRGVYLPQVASSMWDESILVLLVLFCLKWLYSVNGDIQRALHSHSYNECLPHFNIFFQFISTYFSWGSPLTTCLISTLLQSASYRYNYLNTSYRLLATCLILLLLTTCSLLLQLPTYLIPSLLTTCFIALQSHTTDRKSVV